MLLHQRAHRPDRPPLDSSHLPSDHKTRALTNAPPVTIIIDNKTMETVIIDNKTMETVIIDNKTMETVIIDNKTTGTIRGWLDIPQLYGNPITSRKYN